MTGHSIDRELEARVEELGFEVVELERAGAKSRPLLRLRIDRPDSEPGHGVTVDDCARVSRALETYLDEAGVGDGRYTLEVSSPGVERPLVRRRDWERFAGAEVRLRGKQPLAGRARKLEGVLLGLDGAGGDERVRLRLEDGDEVEVPLAEVSGANLVFRW